ncbi:MAG: deoxyribonuclease V [Anaerolineae bacterium]
MTIKQAISHPWEVSTDQALEIQRSLRGRVIELPPPERPAIVAGIDVNVNQGQTRAAVVLLSFPQLVPFEVAKAERPETFPYVPGLLAFREGPVVLQALQRLTETPDVLIFDAQGVAHPRRMGLATHLGILVDMPSIGCAKSRLCGEHTEPDSKKGNWTRLYDGDEVIGAVVRTREDVKPVFVSIGHRMNLDMAVQLVVDCAPNYRLPETTRWAHRIARGASLPRNSQPGPRQPQSATTQ